MEDLFPILIVIIGSVVSILNASKKEKEKQAAEARRRETAMRRLEARELLQQAQPQPAAPVAAPAIPGMPADAPVAPLAPAAPAAPAVSVTTTVHPHLAPDCGIHDRTGSLNFASTEGKDHCHEEMLTFDRSESAPAQATPGLTFDWSGESLVKAFVMQEILTRPGQRRAR